LATDGKYLGLASMKTPFGRSGTVNIITGPKAKPF
jgi:hypothetical protein